MTALQRCIRGLIGHGVTLRHVDKNKLLINGAGDFLQQADVTAIRDYKYLLIHILPKDKTFTAADVDNGLEYYIERTAILWHGGTGYEIEQAKNMAIPCAHQFMCTL